MESIPRLSSKEAEILRLLIANGEMYGLELVDASDRLKAGTIYVTLQRMADKGFVESRTVKAGHEPGLPRRLFKPTGLGERVLHAWEVAGVVFAEVPL